MERASAWGESKSKDKAEIARVNTEAMERAREKAKAIVKEKAISVQRANAETRVAVEASAKIRYSAKIQGEKRERAEDD